MEEVFSKLLNVVLRLKAKKNKAVRNTVTKDTISTFTIMGTPGVFTIFTNVVEKKTGKIRLELAHSI